MDLKNKFLAVTFFVASCISTNADVFAFPADSSDSATTQNNSEIKDLQREQEETAFILNGVKIISGGREKFEGEIVQKYLYKKNTLGTLNNLAAELTRLYRANGFLAAVAYIPPQKNLDGVVEINVIQGFYDDIKIDSKIKISPTKIKSIVSKIKIGDPVRKMALEDVLYKLNDIDGIKASGFFTQGKKEGSTILNITVERDKNSRHILYTDNYGNRSAGQYRLGLLNDFYNVDKSGTKITVGGLFSTKKSMDLYADTNFIFASRGTTHRLGLHVGRSSYKLGDEYRDLDANGNSINFSIYGTTTARKTISSSVSYIYGMNYNDMKDSLDAFNLEALKHSYSAHVGVIGNERWKNNHLVFTQKVTAGHLLNDSVYANYLNSFNHTEGVYFKLNHDFDYTYEINNSFNFGIHASWQLANKNLDSSERMTFTGINGIKAYPSSDLSADTGFLARGILTYRTGLKYLSANIFIEHAEGKPRKAIDYKVYLHGWGIGLSYAKPDDYFVKLDYARRIGFDEALSERAKAKGRFWFIAGKIF